MIAVTKLNKYYPVGKEKFHALKDIDLTIDKGEFVAVQGKSGSGKSTLLNILGCLDGFDKGQYRLMEQDVGKMNDEKTAKMRNEHIGFVLQDFSLVNSKSVLFNVMLPLYFGKVPYRKMKPLALDALKQVGLNDQAIKKANQLSGGQRQRVAIARALVSSPDLILADEPTGALDSETAAQIMELLRSLNDKGITVVTVTHDDTVAGYCRRRIMIQDGRIVSDTKLLNIDQQSQNIKDNILDK